MQAGTVYRWILVEAATMKWTIIPFGPNVLENNLRSSKVTPFGDCAYGCASRHTVQMDLFLVLMSWKGF